MDREVKKVARQRGAAKRQIYTQDEQILIETPRVERVPHTTYMESSLQGESFSQGTRSSQHLKFSDNRITVDDLDLGEHDYDYGAGTGYGTDAELGPDAERAESYAGENEDYADRDGSYAEPLMEASRETSADAEDSQAEGSGVASDYSIDDAGDDGALEIKLTRLPSSPMTLTSFDVLTAVLTRILDSLIKQAKHTNKYDASVFKSFKANVLSRIGELLDLNLNNNDLVRKIKRLGKDKESLREEIYLTRLKHGEVLQVLQRERTLFHKEKAQYHRKMLLNQRLKGLSAKNTSSLDVLHYASLLERAKACNERLR